MYVVGIVSCYWIVIVDLKELALQVCCNFEVGDNTFCKFWRGWVVLPKGFSPPENLCVSVFTLSLYFCMHDWLNIIVHRILNL